MPTIEGIIGQIFDNLERDFGKVLVRAVLIILTLSVNGISDVEMQDLLSIDDRVLDFAFQYQDQKLYVCYRLVTHSCLSWSFTC